MKVKKTLWVYKKKKRGVCGVDLWAVAFGRTLKKLIWVSKEKGDLALVR